MGLTGARRARPGCLGLRGSGIPVELVLATHTHTVLAEP